MGFWDREVQGPFDDVFDLNRDGSLDLAEQAFQDEYILKEMEGDAPVENDDDTDIGDLELMDEDERREALEEAGFDPDDFGGDF